MGAVARAGPDSSPDASPPGPRCSSVGCGQWRCVDAERRYRKHKDAPQDAHMNPSVLPEDATRAQKITLRQWKHPGLCPWTRAVFSSCFDQKKQVRLRLHCCFSTELGSHPQWGARSLYSGMGRIPPTRPIPCSEGGPPASSTRCRSAASGWPTWGEPSHHVDVMSPSS